MARADKRRDGDFEGSDERFQASEVAGGAGEDAGHRPKRATAADIDNAGKATKCGSVIEEQRTRRSQQSMYVHYEEPVQQDRVSSPHNRVSPLHKGAYRSYLPLARENDDEFFRLYSDGNLKGAERVNEFLIDMVSQSDAGTKE